MKAPRGEALIDEHQVRMIARSMAEIHTTRAFYEWLVPSVSSDDETAFRAYLWTSAICHATQGGLRGFFRGRWYKGWDYLLRAFCCAGEANPHDLSPDRMLLIDSASLRDLLRNHAADAEVTLPDLDRRAAILRVTAGQLLDAWNGAVTEMLESTYHRMNGDGGAYDLLARFSAFQDVQRKKSSAFIMTVHFSKKWAFADAHQADPMIDYHRMRLLLRTGCIRVNEGLTNALSSQVVVDDSVAERIRDLAATTTIELQRQSGHEMFELDVLLWMHARSCCRNIPLCQSRRYENESFPLSVDRIEDTTCVFESCCVGAKEHAVRNLWEPIHHTEDY